MFTLASTPAGNTLASTPTRRVRRGLPIAGVLWGCALLGCVLAGCASERSVLVEVSGAGGADRLCLVASDGERVLFSRAYGDDVLGAPAGGTLTFVAGSEIDSSLVVTARSFRAGMIVGAATGTTGFGEAGTVTLPLAVARCHPRSARAATFVARDVVRVEAVGVGSSLAAGDVDGDGRDEALLLGIGGTLVLVDVERGRAVATTATGTGGRVVALGDLDGDCSLDAVVLAANGVHVLYDVGGAARMAPAASDSSGAVDASLGAASSGPRIAICGPAQVSLLAAHGTAGPIVLASDASRAVLAADLTGDRRAEIIAAGSAGARVWIASDAGFIAAPAALPPSFVGVSEYLVALDGNGDGPLDLAGAGPSGLELALNRGDGRLEAHAGSSAPSVAVAALLAVDLDGDCHDELAVLGADGALTFYSAEGALIARAEAFEGVSRAAAGDFDGDGAQELVCLGLDGMLRVVAP